MKYAVYTLKFLTPVHFGDSAGGGSLEKRRLFAVPIRILVHCAAKRVRLQMNWLEC